MARLIDADEAKNVIRKNDWSNPCVPTVVSVILDRIPTIEAEPVRHGRWRSGAKTITKDFVCSECLGHVILHAHAATCWYNYCPHCGAKMDEKENEHETD